VSPKGDKIGYINEKNCTTNVMIKSSSKGGASVQRTFRTNVQGFSWSPDGKELCFTEIRGGHQGIYLVSADQGTVVKQISNSGDNDMGGVVSRDGNTIFFHRGEGYSSYSLWSYDRKTNLFSNYSRGMTACLIPGDPNTIYCGRFTDKKESEIWRINFQTGVEELILGAPNKSYTSPQLSPDGKWLLVTGNSKSEKEGIANTDIFVVRTDGTQLTQLTFHPGNDLSPIWSPDGRSIFFISQRGSKDKNYNVWRMDFNL
jgi:Tol biopolymer transport system component